MPEIAKHLKLVWINTKNEDRVFIRNYSKEYKHKSIPISTQRYKDEGAMEKSVLYITDSVRHQKKGIDNIRCNGYWSKFCCEVTCSEYWYPFFYTQLPLNEDDNNYEEQLNDINYKKTVKTLHDTCWKKTYFISADVSMLGYGFCVYQYPQFFVKDLDIY